MDISPCIFFFLMLFRVMVFIQGNIIFESPFLGILPGIVIKRILGMYASIEVPWILHRFSTQLLFTHVQLFCDPIDYSLSGPSVNEIFQARLLEWFAIFFSKGSSGPKDWTHSFCIGRQTLYHWATREAHIKSYWGRAIFLNFTVICSDWIGLSQNPDICN